MPRVYCAVYGCLNSAFSKPEISFFKLPTDDERRSKWLYIISREDLVNKKPQNYTVCEEHFDPSDVLPGPRRKKLKFSAIPCLHLPDLKKRNVHTLTETLKLAEKSIQTELLITHVVNKSTQTSDSLPSDSDVPRKRKLNAELIQCKKVDLPEKYQKELLQKLCDRFLTKELAALVKEQTNK